VHPLDTAARTGGTGGGRGAAVINPPALVEPRGYAHAVEVTGPGRWLVLAGQTALDPQGRITAPGDLVGQFDRVLGNITTVLAAAGMAPDDVVRMRIYVTDVRAYKEKGPELGRVWRAHFGRHYPAMTLVEVSRLYDDGAVVEVEAEAFKAS